MTVRKPAVARLAAVAEGRRDSAGRAPAHVSRFSQAPNRGSRAYKQRNDRPSYDRLRTATCRWPRSAARLTLKFVEFSEALDLSAHCRTGLRMPKRKLKN